MNLYNIIFHDAFWHFNRVPNRESKITKEKYKLVVSTAELFHHKNYLPTYQNCQRRLDLPTNLDFQCSRPTQCHLEIHQLEPPFPANATENNQKAKPAWTSLLNPPPEISSTLCVPELHGPIPRPTLIQKIFFSK